ncbi:MAG: hypothetical protein WBC22_07635 [Sedimentisphaerales bacterium]
MKWLYGGILYRRQPKLEADAKYLQVAAFAAITILPSWQENEVPLEFWQTKQSSPL